MHRAAFCSAMRLGHSDCPRGHNGAVSATTLASHCVPQLLGGGPTEYTMRGRVA